VLGLWPRWVVAQLSVLATTEHRYEVKQWSSISSRLHVRKIKDNFVCLGSICQAAHIPVFDHEVTVTVFDAIWVGKTNHENPIPKNSKKAFLQYFLSSHSGKEYSTETTWPHDLTLENFLGS